MRSQSFGLFLGLLAALFAAAIDAKRQCISAVGVLKCSRDQTKATNVEVIAYDRDGPSIFQLVDPDDMMGRTFSDDHGVFRVEGCGSDFDWLPGLYNVPDPYVTITHYCNKAESETIELPEFYTFLPDTKDFGEIELYDSDAIDNQRSIGGSGGQEWRHDGNKAIHYRTASRAKDTDRKVDVDRLMKILHGDVLLPSTSTYAMTPHVDIDDDASRLEESDHEVKTKTLVGVDGTGSWKNALRHRERERYTLEGGARKSPAADEEITTVTLPDDHVALNDVRDALRDTLN